MAFEREIMETKTNMNLIPAYASMNEAVFYVLEDNERNFSDMIKKIGLNELAVYESTGSVLLYEDGSEEKKEADGEKVSFVAKAWANIRAAFEAAMKKLEEIAKKVSTALQGVVAKSAAGVAAGATKKADPAALKNAVDSLSDDFLKGLKNQYKYDKLGKFKPVVGDDVKLSFNENPTEADEQKNYTSVQKIKDHLGVDEINPGSVRDAIRGGDEAITKESIKSNFDDIYKSVTDVKATTSALKVYFKDAKSSYDKLVKASKKSGSDKEAIGGLKALVQATSVVYTAILSEYYGIIFRNARIVLQLNGIANKATKAAKKEEKSGENKEDKGSKGNAGETVEAETLDKDGNVVGKGTATHTGESAVEVDSEIASLFDWSF